MSDFTENEELIFRRLYEQRPQPARRQCQRSAFIRGDLCMNEAKFVLYPEIWALAGKGPSIICEHCLPIVMLTFRSEAEFMVIKL